MKKTIDAQLVAKLLQNEARRATREELKTNSIKLKVPQWILNRSLKRSGSKYH